MTGQAAEKMETHYLWQFIDVHAVFANKFAAVAISDGDDNEHNLAIKAGDHEDTFAITLYKKGWAFPVGEEVLVKIDFFTDPAETITARAAGDTMEMVLDISSAPTFLYLVATSEAMEVSFPQTSFPPWLIGLRFAEPAILAMLRRLTHPKVSI